MGCCSPGRFGAIGVPWLVGAPAAIPGRPPPAPSAGGMPPPGPPTPGAGTGDLPAPPACWSAEIRVSICSSSGLIPGAVPPVAAPCPAPIRSSCKLGIPSTPAFLLARLHSLIILHHLQAADFAHRIGVALLDILRHHANLRRFARISFVAVAIDRRAVRQRADALRLAAVNAFLRALVRQQVAADAKRGAALLLRSQRLAAEPGDRAQQRHEVGKVVGRPT